MSNKVTRMILGFTVGMAAACMTGFAAVAQNIGEQEGPELSYDLSPRVRKFLATQKNRAHEALELTTTARANLPNAKPAAN